VAGCQWPVASCRLPVSSLRFQVSCRLPVAGCQWPVTGYRLPLTVFWILCRKHVSLALARVNVKMKTKLTLTVRKSIIKNARRYSKRSGKSISQLFEEFFETEEGTAIPSKSQRAAERLLKTLESSPPVKTLDDKEALKSHVVRKFA